jgi:hypothetical protein
MSFLKTGSEGEKFFREESERRQQEMSGDGKVRQWRFKIDKNSKGFIVFLDNLDVFLLEHQFQTIVNGKTNYYNYETCIRDIEGECPLCENDNRPALVSVASIIDLTEYKKKDGTMTVPTKKIIVLKKGGTERFLKRQEKLGGLKFKKFEIYRSNDSKGEGTGTDVDFEKDVDPELLKKLAPEGVNPEEWIKPYDYEELFAPKTASEIRKVIGISDPVGASESMQEPAKQSLKDLI